MIVHYNMEWTNYLMHFILRLHAPTPATLARQLIHNFAYHAYQMYSKRLNI